MKQDEEALICDLAETYKIYNYKQYPPSYVAILAKGLNNNSRIKRSYTGLEVSDDYLLQSLIFDRLNLLLWLFGSTKGSNEPFSLYDYLTNRKGTTEQTTGFESSEEFENKRMELLQKIKEGG